MQHHCLHCHLWCFGSQGASVTTLHRSASPLHGVPSVHEFLVWMVTSQPTKCGKTQNTYLKGVSVFENDALFAVLTLGQSPGAAEDQPAARCHHRCPRDECHYRVPDPCAGAQWEQFSIISAE